MRRCALLFAIVLATVPTAAASDNLFTADATAAGTAVMRFLGSNVTIDVTADLHLSGSWVFGDRKITFTAAGTATGSGRGTMDTLAVDLWLTLEVEGKTTSGDAIRIDGVVSVDHLDAQGMGAAEGTGGGRFYLAVAAADSRWWVQGATSGSVSGTFVVPEIESTMQAEGVSLFCLTGTVHQQPLGLDGDATSFWPKEMEERLSTLWAPTSAPQEP